MKHYLNVCDVKGAEVEPVDVISFGSPCQDLSVAGLRKGLKHEQNGDDETTRSGLFMEAVRIIKEMREHDRLEKLRSGRTDEHIRPRFAVWENVPGAFSSNKGEDFRVVLEELARVKETEVSIPMPEKGKWKPAGEIVGDGWSIAWRTLDAQYHGVPQRRRRIFLVADFADECAGEILFECEGLPGYPSKSAEEREGASTDFKDCAGGTSEGIPYTLQIRSGCEGGGKGPLIQTDKSACLTAAQTQTLFQPYCLQGNMIGRKDENGPQGNGINEGVSFTLNTTDKHAVVYGICSDGSNCMKSSNPHSGIYEADTSRTIDCNGGNPACNQGGMVVCEPILFENHSQDTRYKGPLDICPTVSATFGMGGNNTPFVAEPICISAHGFGEYEEMDAIGSLMCGQNNTIRSDTPLVLHPSMNLDGSDKSPTYAMTSETFFNVEEDKTPTLKARDYKDPQVVCYSIDREAFNCGENFARELGISDDGITPTLIARGPSAVCYKPEVHYIVRRLTPTECARLQGMPDRWCRLHRITEMTDEELEFWNEAHKVHASINGKTYKPKTKEQMINWYNKLQTDGAEYKAYGNGMALPCVRVPIHGIAQHGAKTMASLFDGIGGFPLAGMLDGIETLWTSEIELFPIAVTIERFGRN